jgi:zinc transport system substrate-binding protein
VILRLILAAREQGGIASRTLRVAGSSLAVLALAAMVACNSSSNEKGGGGTLSVVASFYPIAEAAQHVGGPLVSVTDLTAPGVEPHDLELTPRQLADVADADVVLYLGGGFQPAVQDAVVDAQGETVDVAPGLQRMPVPSGESEEGLTSDPHVWLDPVLYGRIVDTVEAALSRADASSASTFASNARAFQDQISGLDDEYRTGLRDCARHEIVTSHAAFGYLAARYGLRQLAISGISPDAEPTPQHLAELRTFVREHDVTTIFTEELLSPKVAETLAAETGATTEILSPLESLTPDEIAAGEDYVSVMRSNLAKLEQALGCR